MNDSRPLRSRPEDPKVGKKQGGNNRAVGNFIVVSGAVAERLSLSLSYPEFSGKPRAARLVGK